ncbi:MAG: hypothetical protein JWO24_1728 [Rhodospirillales bacterium]|nr:hypothetical protein [Rhodospirillales bacterium]
MVSVKTPARDNLHLAYRAARDEFVKAPRQAWRRHWTGLAAGRSGANGRESGLFHCLGGEDAKSGL